MNTKTYKTVLEQRVCYKLAFLRGKRAGHTMPDLNYEVTRQANRLLIELGLNHALWCRVYRTRVFMYNIQSRRAVLELGLVTNYTGSSDANDDRLHRGFELVIMGGIYNYRVTDDLIKLTVSNKPIEREKQYVTHHSSSR